MRIWVLILQSYISFAQVVPPVAYLPDDSLRRGYRVIAELSRGWQGPIVPFCQKEEWQLIRILSPVPSAFLYITGVKGRIAVFQDHRLLYQDTLPYPWIPLLPASKSLLRIEGSAGGIQGGVYLVALSDTLAWPASPMAPPSQLCSSILSASNQSSPPFLANLALLWIAYGLVALLVSTLPRLRLLLWQVYTFSTRLDLIERVAVLCVALVLLALALFSTDPLIFSLVSGFLALEGVILYTKGKDPAYAGSTWILPALILLTGQALAFFSHPQGIYLLWSLRAIGLILRLRDFLYLCIAEASLYFLIRSP